MSIAPREHQCSIRPRTCDGQSGFGQRQTEPSSSSAPIPLVALEPHSGQCFGKLKTVSFPVRLFNTTPTTAGITSPAFSMMTVSPTRMSFRRNSSSLCSVARLIVLPARKTGSNSATGVSAPVRPDLNRDGFEFRLRLFGGVFVGDRPARRLDVAPIFSRNAKEFSLMTAPSV